MPPDSTAGTRARTLESTQWHMDNCSKHTCHATCNCKHALSTSTRGTLGSHVAPSKCSPRRTCKRTRTRTRTHTHTHTETQRHTERERDTHTHTHTHFSFRHTHVTMCSPTIRYPRHRRVLHHTTYDRLCSVCSFSSVLNGNVGCSAHLRTAAERHSPRFGFRERSVFQSGHHVQNKTKARTPLAHRTRRPRLT